MVAKLVLTLSSSANPRAQIENIRSYEQPLDDQVAFPPVSDSAAKKRLVLLRHVSEKSQLQRKATIKNGTLNVSGKAQPPVHRATNRRLAPRRSRAERLRGQWQRQDLRGPAITRDLLEASN